MRKRTSLILAVALLGSLLTFVPAQADHADAFTFYIPYPADQLELFFEAGVPGFPQRPNGLNTTAIETVISISVLRPGTRIYYDNWEDGLEPNLFVRTQSSTQIWGDNDPTTGVPPDPDGPGPLPAPSDAQLERGDVITLNNGSGSVPVPRDPADVLYDGGDKVVSVGGSIAVTLAVWPISNPGSGILFAGAWELHPTSRWGIDYVIPVGQNVLRPGDGYRIVGFNVQAVDEGTTVDLDLDADGNFEVLDILLGQGESHTVISGVQAGAAIHAEGGPVQVHTFTKDPDDRFQARADTMLPLPWTNEYLAPRTSDGDIWVYNPHQTDLVVNVQTLAGTTSITVPARSAGRYPPLTGPQTGPFITDRTGAHLTSADGREFFGLVALDPEDVQDWGYALQPVSNLTTQSLMGWAPNYDFNYTGAITSAGFIASRIYVTSPDPAAPITIHVDYDNDGNADPADDRSVSHLEEVFILDAADDDMTGARLFTDGEPFMAVWGQDQDAPDAQPSIDVGTNIVPLRAPSIQMTYELIQEGYTCGTTPVQGNRVRFELAVFNDSSQALPEVRVTNNLEPGIVYVSGSTSVRGSPISDDSTGSPFPLDDPGFDIGTLNADERVPITYEAIIADAGVFPNEASATDADPASVEVEAPFRLAGYQVSKTLVNPASGPANPGQAITFSLSITNTGTVAITELPLRDEFDPAFLTFQGASPVNPDLPATGVLTWTNLIPALGPLAPGSRLDLTLNFRVNDTLPSREDTINRILSQGVRGADAVQQAILCDEAAVQFATVTVTSTPTETPTTTMTPTATRTATRDNRCEDCDITVTATRTTPPPAPAVTPTPVVQFLPETGVAGSPAFPMGLVLALPVLGLALLLALRRREE